MGCECYERQQTSQECVCPKWGKRLWQLAMALIQIKFEQEREGIKRAEKKVKGVTVSENWIFWLIEDDVCAAFKSDFWLQGTQ